MKRVEDPEIIALLESRKVTDPDILAKLEGGNRTEADKLKGGARSFTEGMTFGWGDEIGLGVAALAASIGSGKSPAEIYDDMRSAYDEEQGQYRKENPGTSLALDLAGGLMTGGVGAVKAVPKAVTTGKRLLSLGKTGATMGGVAGAGYADEGEKISGGIKGAVTGGILGAGIPAAASVAGKAVRPVLDRMGAAGSVTKRQIAKDMATAGLDEQSAIRARQAMGNDATMADLADVLRGRAETVSVLPGAGRQASKIFETRNTNAGQRVADATDSMFGGRVKLDDFVDDIVVRAEKQAGPLYKEAMSRPVEMTDELRGILSTPTMRKAWSSAKRMAADEQRRLPEIMHTQESGMVSRYGGAYQPESVQTTLETVPDMEAFNYMKKALDTIIESTGTTPMGKMTEKGRVMVGLKNRLLSELDRQNPTYSQARKVYGGLAETKRAAEEGLKFWNMTDEQIARRLSEASQAERDAFKLGALQRIYQEAKKTTDGGSAWSRLFNSADKRDKIRAVLQDDDAFRQFEQKMKAEDAFNKTYQATRANSRTAMREAGVREATVEPERAAPLLQGNWKDAAFTLMRSAANRVNAPTDAQRSELSRLLMSSGPDADKAIKEVFTRAPNFYEDPEAMRKLAAILSGEAGYLSGSSYGR